MTAPRPLMLIDTAAMYFRAFHALPDSMRAPDGTCVNAVRGTLDMIARLATELQPGGIVACWDDDWRPQWRVDLVPSYKAHRVAEPSDEPAEPDEEDVPDLLEPQVDIIAEALPLLGIPVVGVAEHEADDVIGTLAASWGGPVDVVTSDRDLFQVVDDARGVRVVYTGKGMNALEFVDEAWLQARYGITAAQYADFAVLRGDPSDGLPGVKGIGEKTAAGLLAEYGDLAGVAAAARDEASSLKPAVRARILDANEYLAAAPTVVRVVRNLDISAFDATSGIADRAAFEQLAERWGLGASAERVLGSMAT